MALASLASQLRAAQEASSNTVQMASVTGSFQDGAGRARGALRSFVGSAQAQAARLGGHSVAAPVVHASDGSCCQACGSTFGILRRRQMCASCDRFLCAACLGSTAGISCLCASVCPRCKDQSAQGGALEACREAMEQGVSVTIGLPKKASGVSLFGGSTGDGGSRKLMAWLTIDCDTGDIRWASLERKGGQPIEESCVSVCEVLNVRDTGVAVELSVKGQTRPTVLEFGSPSDRSDWARYLRLVVDVLTPDSERETLEALRAGHRQKELEERRALNEERRKKLSENLGMRFTAEAMAARQDRPRC
mmetsp:Transcript_45984/g.127672  ORF Transcript_45984/g.127672 Transcript_45984/m.127672 type:complete len:306 (+) Transcript_45984:55-972(+)